MSSTAKAPAVLGSLVLLGVSCLPGSPDELDGRLGNAQNYSFTGALDVPSVETASGLDVEICWDELVSDIQCHDLDPVADIDNVSLVRFSHLDEVAVEAGMSDSTLQQADISGYVESRTESNTCTSLSGMSFFGTSIDVTSEYTESGGTYLLLLTTGTEPAVGSRMLTFIAPRTSSDNTRVDVTGGCGVLDFTVDLLGLEPLRLPVDGPWEVDWSGVSIDGRGLVTDFESVDVVKLAYYSELELEALERDFLDLEILATSLWSASIESGSSIDLSGLTGETGVFGGFHRQGLWVLALGCERCFNPAPLFLTVIEPVEGNSR